MATMRQMQAAVVAARVDLTGNFGPPCGRKRPRGFVPIVEWDYAVPPPRV